MACSGSSSPSSSIGPIGDERLAGRPKPGEQRKWRRPARRIGACGRSVGKEPGDLGDRAIDRLFHQRSRRLGERLVAAGLVLGRRRADAIDRLCDLRRQPLFGGAERLFGGGVEGLELLDRERFPVQNRVGLNAALEGLYAEPEVLRAALKAGHHFAILLLEARTDLLLGTEDLGRLPDRRHLQAEPLDETLDDRRDRAGGTDRDRERDRRFRTKKIMDIDDVRRARARPFREAALDEMEDVLVDRDLRIDGNEHVEARIAGLDAKREGATRDRTRKVEEAIDGVGDVGEGSWVGRLRDEIRGNTHHFAGRRRLRARTDCPGGDRVINRVGVPFELPLRAARTRQRGIFGGNIPRTFCVLTVRHRRRPYTGRRRTGPRFLRKWRERPPASTGAHQGVRRRGDATRCRFHRGGYEH